MVTTLSSAGFSSSVDGIIRAKGGVKGGGALEAGMVEISYLPLSVLKSGGLLFAKNDFGPRDKIVLSLWF